MTTFQKGDFVERLGSLKDYATGRQGRIVELDLMNQRAQVSWSFSPEYKDSEDGKKALRTGGVRPMKPIKTWVNFKFLKSLPVS